MYQCAASMNISQNKKAHLLRDMTFLRIETLPDLPPRHRLLNQIEELMILAGLNDTQLAELLNKKQWDGWRILNDPNRKLGYDETQDVIQAIIGKFTAIPEDLTLGSPEIASMGIKLTWADYEEPLQDAVAKMLPPNNFSQLPVRDKTEKYKGFLTELSIIEYLSRPYVKKTVNNFVKDFQAKMKSPEPLMNGKARRGFRKRERLRIFPNEARVRDLEEFFDKPQEFTVDTPVQRVISAFRDNYAVAVKKDIKDKDIVGLVTRADFLKVIQTTTLWI